METRRRSKQTSTLAERLIQEAANLRRQAQELPPGVMRDDLLRKARQADVGAHMHEWLSSPGLQPPN
jgi:hypothetical protein